MQEVDADLTALDRAIINAFQGGFPVAERPFDAAAAALRERGVEVTGPALCERVRELDEEGILSRFGALVNAEEIGGAASLVAMHAPEDRYDEIAETVNEFTAVAHNYEREHPHLNMWFVVSVADHPDPDKDGHDRVEEVLAEIESATGQETYNLPKLREFHVGAKFLVDGPVPDGDVDLSHLGPEVTPSDRGTLTPDERDLVVEIQGGLPITETPYADVAAAIGADVDWVIETIKRFEREGKVRRVGVIPNHYALGYTENGMTVWDVPEEVLDEVGPAVASLDFVTHCYERPRHAGVWEYNFFAMTHGRTEAESERRIAEVRDLMADHWDVGADDWDTLFSTRILKKTGIRIADRADSNTA
ncbi:MULTISPECIES: Lrp/AsnC family transcriptional regulator [unclassified Halorubrum]|uniref:siroheme decarboxylase subunit beta n=1 Tax=unclassified Halorubrum TaxID=2642239 RepID=UPI0010F5D1B0|nr:MULTISPECIES: Lrp/AsnC family transcriptional regulator [unclassified Halorubrum]TKX45970.1 Lrp/AsnC family transcriptional regulator [Halorubrum sp. ARQ200]TKX50207.1 Lrp/AsnC family transcriptional regulator [Halorubrum sp. ASP121]